MHWTVRDVAEKLEALAPPRLAEEWDRVGLQLGAWDQPAGRILIALTVTDEVIDQAEAWSADLIVAHHPLIFRPLDAIRTDQPAGRRIKRLLSLETAVYVAHTNLDAAQGGVGAWLADRLDLKDASALAPNPSVPAGSEGYGRIGRIEPCSPSRFLDHLTERLALTEVRTAGPAPVRIERVAVLGGSGGRYIPDAARAGADVYVTGDLDFHDALLAEELKLWVVDAGHFGTERWIVAALAEYLEAFASEAGFQIRQAEESDPWSVCGARA